MAHESASPSPLIRRGTAAAVALATFAVFLPALDAGFVNWDDSGILLRNPHYRGFTGETLSWMWTTFHFGHYQPLTWMSYSIDHALGGMNPAGYHFTNLLLHAANAVLFYFLLLALRSAGCTSVWPAAAGALLFSLHPLRVESVAWVTERRDVLSGFFLLLSILTYLKGCRAGSSKRWFVFSLLAFVGSLLSKAWGITLPVVLLLLDAFVLGRFGPGRRRHALLEKIPFALLAAAAAVVAARAQMGSGATATLEQLSFPQRILQAFHGVSFYVEKTVLPAGLSPLYLMPSDLSWSTPRFLIRAILVTLSAVALFFLRRRIPGVALAAGAYILLVSPVLGFLQSGPQIAADRYTYLSCLPWAAALAALLPTRRIAGVAAAAVLAVLGTLTWRQTGVWHDSVRLWSRAVEVEPENPRAWGHLGGARFEQGDLEGAIRAGDEALRLRPDLAFALANRAAARVERGDLGGAVEDASHALELDPSIAEAWEVRGRAKNEYGDLDGAIRDYGEALRIEPGLATAYSNRGTARHERGDLDGAALDYDAALRLDPGFAGAYANRGKLRLDRKDFEGAVADCTEALRLHPGLVSSHLNRGNAFRAMGRHAKAVADYDETIRLASGSAEARVGRALSRRAMGDTVGAAEDLQHSLELAPPDWPIRAQVERTLGELRR